VNGPSEIKQQVVDATATMLTSQLTDFLLADPKEHLVQIAGIASHLAATEQDRQRARDLQRYFTNARDLDPQPMPLQMLDRVSALTSPHCRARLVTNFIKWTRTGVPKRQASLQEIGASPMVLLISPSMRCNLSCTGCYASEYDRADDLPMDVIDRVVLEAQDAARAEELAALRETNRALELKAGRLEERCGARNAHGGRTAGSSCCTRQSRAAGDRLARPACHGWRCSAAACQPRRATGCGRRCAEGSQKGPG